MRYLYTICIHRVKIHIHWVTYDMHRVYIAETREFDNKDSWIQLISSFSSALFPHWAEFIFNFNIFINNSRWQLLGVLCNIIITFMTATQNLVKNSLREMTGFLWKIDSYISLRGPSPLILSIQYVPTTSFIWYKKYLAWKIYKVCKLGGISILACTTGILCDNVFQMPRYLYTSVEINEET